ncbi:hypothetical protein K458DRAFT_418712 [Lentithecium fluviatile CBS 122367]|uniref:Uncharacterized protein n=1 Tax=Lentithecium fluviatile CBS 122367 TaxID=1168545 RepID=A0A6G1J063_9PLEO|nr:hypothetical protein K458DRAFT_418712 [Lentithecium fluviatile CBS 122367]
MAAPRIWVVVTNFRSRRPKRTQAKPDDEVIPHVTDCPTASRCLPRSRDWRLKDPRWLLRALFPQQQLIPTTIPQQHATICNNTPRPSPVSPAVAENWRGDGGWLTALAQKSRGNSTSFLEAGLASSRPGVSQSRAMTKAPRHPKRHQLVVATTVVGCNVDAAAPAIARISRRYAIYSYLLRLTLSRLFPPLAQIGTKKKTSPNTYGPGDKMPPLKYRRPVNPEHKAHLEAFNWAKAWRRKSEQSLYSPMGSRMPSRRNSFQSFGRRSMAMRRSKSLTRTDDGSAVDSGIGASVAGDDRPEQLREGSDEEGDVTNVGLSRQPTNDPTTQRKSSSVGRRSQSIKSGSSRPATADRARRSLSTTKTDAPFSQEDLELALKRSNLEATKEESDRSGDATPGSPGGGMLKVPADGYANPNVVHVERLRERERMVC